MQSSQTYHWHKPIRFDADLMAAIEAKLGEYQADYLADIVKSLGLNNAEITSSAKLNEVYEATKDRPTSMYRAILEMQSIENLSYSLVFKDGTQLKNLTRQNVLALPNVKQKTIEVLEVGFRSIFRVLTLVFTERNSVHAVEIANAGTFTQVQIIRSDLEAIFESVTQPWHLFRNSTAIALFWLAILILSALPSCIGHHGAKDRDDESLASIWHYSITNIFLFVCLSGLFLVIWVECYRWIFPRVDFRINGGVKRSNWRRWVRVVVWTVGICLLGFPYLVNQLPALHH